MLFKNEKIKSLFKKISLLIFIFLFTIFSIWILSLLGDAYPKAKFDKFGHPSFSKAGLFPPNYRLKCTKIRYFWQGKTKDSTSRVESYYKNKWKDDISTGTLSPFHYVPFGLSIKEYEIYVDKTFNFMPPYEEDTIIAVDTNIYLCTPK